MSPSGSQGGELIRWTDFDSRGFHSDDVSVDWGTFRWAEQFFGKPFSVDGFASGSNSKCAGFFPKRFIPGTSGVDFFMQELSSEDFFWLFPPVNLLCKTVEHPALFRSSDVLLLLVWPNLLFSYFFPEGRHLPEWVSAVVPIKPTFWLVLWLQASFSGVLDLGTVCLFR